MKTFIVGVIALALWSALSTYIYVCKIQGLCNVPVSLQASVPAPESIMLEDTVTKVELQELAVLPRKIVTYFEFDKSDFKVTDLTKKYSNESNVYLKQYSSARLVITGHTDAIGTEEYNQNLGYRRAENAKQYFENAGIPATKISIESKGEIQPADNNSTTKGRANNRRTEITINN